MPKKGYKQTLKHKTNIFISRAKSGLNYNTYKNYNWMYGRLVKQKRNEAEPKKKVNKGFSPRRRRE